jgi:hypothetical protein
MNLYYNGEGNHKIWIIQHNKLFLKKLNKIKNNLICAKSTRVVWYVIGPKHKWKKNLEIGGLSLPNYFT